MSGLKSKIGKYIYNLPGWRSRRKIVVIESDDWGSERTPSKDIYSFLLRKGLRVDLCPFSKFDSLENNTDIEDLFSVLKLYKDHLGNYPVVTANFNVANPDFRRILDSKYNEYYYYNYIDTLSQYPNHDKVVDLILKTGIREKIFLPQYHSREHLNINIWLEQLKAGHNELKIGFEAGVYGFSRAVSSNIKRFHLASLIYRNEKERQEVFSSLTDGVKLFEDIFSYKPSSFIAPVYIWNSEIERLLFKLNIMIIQGGFIQKVFTLNDETEFNSKYNYLGKVNRNGQIYLTRNCIFEPSLFERANSVSNCINQMKIAFRLNKPAIISSHRLNFMGGIEASNRERGLEMLVALFKEMLKLWPEIEFMTSVDLGNLILLNDEN